MVNVGDTVRVRTSGRRAIVVEDRGNDLFEVEFIPDPAGDPVDRETLDTGDVGGMYKAGDLEPV